jgi:hypothetical protein
MILLIFIMLLIDKLLLVHIAQVFTCESFLEKSLYREDLAVFMSNFNSLLINKNKKICDDIQLAA